ncbi:MAG: hypothetical protein WC551_03960 [Patescibacteria group bacterium]
MRYPLSPASPVEYAFSCCGEPHQSQHTMYPIRSTIPSFSSSVTVISGILAEDSDPHDYCAEAHHIVDA